MYAEFSFNLTLVQNVWAGENTAIAHRCRSTVKSKWVGFSPFPTEL